MLYSITTIEFVENPHGSNVIINEESSLMVSGWKAVRLLGTYESNAYLRKGDSKEVVVAKMNGAALVAPGFGLKFFMLSMLAPFVTAVGDFLETTGKALVVASSRC